MPLPNYFIDRYKDWKHNTFPNNENLFKTLEKKGQRPKAMIISCCDSRVNPNSIFKAKEGDFFIHRNIANLIPSYNAKKINYETLAAIEYATNTLSISNIIVLGHSCCGGIDYANKNKLPLFIITSSGGARMQEGVYSLMQLAKISTKLAEFSDVFCDVFRCCFLVISWVIFCCFLVDFAMAFCFIFASFSH